MAENKRFYWLKLPNDWFGSKPIKRLRKLENGDTFTIIYLKMLLNSLVDDGKLYFEGFDNGFAEELALDLDEEVEDVKMTVDFLLQYGMLKKCSDEEYHLSEVEELTGSETASTRRSRQSREKQKKLQCNTNATPLQQECNTEIEKEYRDREEIDIEYREEIDDNIGDVSDNPTTPQNPKSNKTIKHKYGQCKNVLLSDEDMQKLQEEFPNDYQDRIERLSDYMASTGRPYKNHLATIRNWSRQDNQQKPPEKKTSFQNYPSSFEVTESEKKRIAKMLAEYENEEG